MQEDRTPKIFISYSWSSDALVVPLAERLVSHGVDVVLDKWELREGQDKYTFMEQCVNDPEITKVLIICDEAYAKKANSRTGGVGDETVIISSEIYGKMKQEKFIPVIAERDAEGNAFVPTYIKSRIYIDLSNEDTYEVEYEKLLRNIYQKPLYSKPKLGKRPEWIDEEKTNLFPLTDLIRQIKGANSAKKQQSCVNRFTEEYISTLKTYFIHGINGQQTYDRFVEMKAIRDVFLDFLTTLAETELQFSDVICGFFERIHNTLTCGINFNPQSYSPNDGDYEIFNIHIWELFICTIVYLRHIENYREINGIVANTYFLTTVHYNNDVIAKNYCAFRFHSRLIEESYKPTTANDCLFTLVGDTLCKAREKLPIYTSEAIAEADLFLYQIRNAFDLACEKNRWGDQYWFPTCYIYANTSPCEWTKMKSRKFCTKMYELFGVENLEQLKAVVAKCTPDSDMRYRRSFGSAPAILSCISLDEIGSVN